MIRFIGSLIIMFLVVVSAHAQVETPPALPPVPDYGVVCIQVITPARNPQTGEVREFPTPCDVPAGWEVVRNNLEEAREALERSRMDAQKRLDELRIEQQKRLDSARDEANDRLQTTADEGRDRLRMTREAFEQKRETARQNLTVRAAALKEELDSRREAAKTQLEQKREELKARIAGVRDEAKKQIIERVYDSVNSLNERMTNHFANALNQIEEVLSRVHSRIDKAAANGLDVANAQSKADAAKTAIDNARAKVAEQAGKNYSFSIPGDAATGANVEAIKQSVQNARQLLHRDLKAVQGVLIAVRDTVHQAAVALAQIPRIDEVDIPDDTSTTSTTSDGATSN